MKAIDELMMFDVALREAREERLCDAADALYVAAIGDERAPFLGNRLHDLLLDAHRAARALRAAVGRPMAEACELCDALEALLDLPASGRESTEERAAYSRAAAVLARVRGEKP